MLLYIFHYSLFPVINHPCYPTRYCGPNTDITCKSMNGDEKMDQCQCKEGLTWNNHLSQCSNETANQECDYGHIFISATSTECEPGTYNCTYYNMCNCQSYCIYIVFTYIY